MANLLYGKIAPGTIGQVNKVQNFLFDMEAFVYRRVLILRFIIISIIVSIFLVFIAKIGITSAPVWLIPIVVIASFYPRIFFKPFHVILRGIYKAVEQDTYKKSYIPPLDFSLYTGYSSGLLSISKGHPQGIAPHQHIALNLQDACQNIVTIGGIGSGKTTRVIQPMLAELLRQDCGGLIFDIKSDFKYAADAIANHHGKQIKIIGIDELPINLIEGLTPEMSASFLKSAFYLNGGGAGNDSFWIDTATALCQNALGVLNYTNDYTLDNLYKYLFYPEHYKTYTQKAKEIIPTLSDKDQAILENYICYHEKVFCAFDDKVQRGVLASVSQVLSPFLHPEMIKAFCSQPDNKAELESVLNGDIYLVNLPLSTWGVAGKAVYTFIKLRFFNILQSRPNRKDMNQTRPVFFMCDEYQEIISANKTGISDLNFWDKSRSAKCIGIISAQSINSFRSAIGDNTLADTILQNFRQKIFFRTEDIETIEYMNALAGKIEVQRTSYTEGISRHGMKYGSNEGMTTNWTEREIVDPSLIRGLNQNQAIAFMNIGGMAADDIVNLTPLFVD